MPPKKGWSGPKKDGGSSGSQDPAIEVDDNDDDQGQGADNQWPHSQDARLQIYFENGDAQL